MKTRSIMRPAIALLSLPLLVVAAHAEKKGSSGGALSGVSAGIGRASGSGGYSPPSGSVDRTDTDARIAEVCYDGNGRLVDEHAVDECYYPRVHHDGNAVLVKRKARVEPPTPTARARSTSSSPTTASCSTAPRRATSSARPGWTR